MVRLHNVREGVDIAELGPDEGPRIEGDDVRGTRQSERVEQWSLN
jgi:hypothetical protein